MAADLHGTELVAGLTPRQVLVLLRLRAALRRYACARCQRAPKQGRNHYCRYCNAQIRAARTIFDITLGSLLAHGTWALVSIALGPAGGWRMRYSHYLAVIISVERAHRQRRQRRR